MSLSLTLLGLCTSPVDLADRPNWGFEMGPNLCPGFELIS